MAPQFLYASPSSAAVVELFACAYAIISAKWVDCEASRLKVLILSVTTWDASARSILEAAANCRTPSIPERIWLTDHPAKDMFVIAPATSVAENFVLLPRLFALDSSVSSSEPVAPEIASTSLIPASKELPTSTTYSAASTALSFKVPSASAATDTPFITTALAIFSPIPVNTSPASPAFVFKSSTSVFACFTDFPNSSMLVAHPSAEFLASSRYFLFSSSALLFLRTSASA